MEQPFTFFDAMKIMVIFVWTVAAVVQIWGALQKPRKEYDWLKFGLGILAIYWAFYYTQSAFFRFIEMNHQVWVRTPILLTGAFVAGCGIYTLMRRKL
jgi:hypothetical protein